MIEILDRTCANGRYRVLQLPPKSETPSNLFTNDLIHLKNILATVAESDSNSQVLFEQEEIKIKAENPLVMCGGLASLAYWGLVYKPQEKMSSREVLLGIHDYLDELTAKKWLEAQCYVSFSAWSPWFIGVGFDYTYIIMLKDFSKCYLICLTDTD
jgi:hypothetical protein